jgi:hypothetical protein
MCGVSRRVGIPLYLVAARTDRRSCPTTAEESSSP